MAHTPGTLLLAGVAAAAGALPAIADDPGARVRALFERYEVWQAVEPAAWESSLEVHEARGQALDELLEDLGTIDLDDLGPVDRMDAEVFGAMVEDVASYWRFEDLLPLTSHRGIHLRLESIGSSYGYWTAGRLGEYNDMIVAVAAEVQTTIALLKRGLARGWTPPARSIADVPQRLAALIESDFEQMTWPYGAAFGAGRNAAVEARWREFRGTVRPAIKSAVEDLAEYLAQTYLPRCRTSIGISDLPGGADFYAYELRTTAETTRTPRQVHDLGLAEVRRIQRAMITLIRDDLAGPVADPSAGDDARLAAFNEDLRSGPEHRYDDAEAILDDFCRMAKRVDGWLPRLFSVLPRLPYGILPAPPGLATLNLVEFRPGDLSGGYANTVYINTGAVAQHRTYGVTPLLLHEGAPGHHLQLALAMELEDRPAFRRTVYFYAAGEGWALYAERLGYDMGLYVDPIDRYGVLNSEMHRACRLVVDTGIHALGWSRERARGFLLEKTALAVEHIDAEIDRYVARPGQACAYKIGELRITALRAEAERRLGERFDLRVFHDTILEIGSVPLDVLERYVRAWIDEQHEAGR